jgi:16S rRNA (adenine1518-N6/adenine1519-N6)-dimethyltransferase
LLHSINYDSPKELAAFLEERGLGMRKKFGQNFLINPAARAKLLDALELAPGDNVWEIGPGLGAMTAGLLERGGRVTAFEIDSAFARILRDCFAAESSGGDPAFRLVEGDALKTWPSVGADGDLYLLGNLPYNIAAALLADFIEKGRFFKRIVVTVQKEVALRMAAPPASPEYSSFSVLCASVYNVKLLNVIKGSSFYPAPKIDSQGARLDPLPEKRNLSKFFYPLVRSLFSARRKMIKNTLTRFAASVIIKPEDAADAAAETFVKTGIGGERRPETLSVDEFAALAVCLEDFVSRGK